MMPSIATVIEQVQSHAVLVTIALAFIGFFAKYGFDLRLAKRKDRLERINLQLRLLYGPLYSLTQASNTAWRAFRSKHRPEGRFFDRDQPPSTADLAAWRLWMETVFMPLNTRMEEVILQNADLVIGDWPPEFVDVIAHVNSYKTVLRRWENSDLEDHLAVIEFPKAIERLAKDHYLQLKREQASLLA